METEMLEHGGEGGGSTPCPQKAGAREKKCPTYAVY